MRVWKLSFQVVLAIALPLLLEGCSRTAWTDSTAAPQAQSGFSFVVYGDSRPMMYLPYKQDQEAEARQLMVEMFELVLPAKVAPKVVQKDVKLNL